MGCNLLILELVLKGIGRVHQTDFVISHQWIELILVTETQKWHLQGPNQSKWAVIYGYVGADGYRQCSQMSPTEPTYVGPDRTTLDDVTVQACAMG